MKKLTALVLALMLVLSMALSVSAEETFTITIPAGDTHQYEIYQIFTGKYHEDDTERSLSNIVWGVNGTGKANSPVDQTVLDELKSVNTGTDSEKLAVISQYVTLTNPHKTISGGAEAQTVSVDPGYYLIKDVNGSVTGHDAYTTYIVKIVDDVTVNRKAAQPTVDKQVWDEEDDAEANHTNGWGETADHAIGESFQFKLIATLPADVDFNAYESYQVVFNDTMSVGITFESIESVTVDGSDVTQYTCSATTNQAGGSWTLTIADITAVSGVNLADGAEIEVIYKAHLNENAVIGNVDDNKNTVYLQYSNNPNAGGSGDLGTTSDDTVWVFTYEMKNTKTTGNGDKLEGATFAVKNSAGQYYSGVVDGVVTWVSSTDPVNDRNVYKVTSDDQGNFTIVGLDAGTYILTEIVTPAGYNTCADITVVISATHKENSKTEAETIITMTKDGTEADEITVVNQSGATLPETGGMGTTMFYVIGGILVLAAVVLLVTKKRMASAD